LINTIANVFTAFGTVGAVVVALGLALGWIGHRGSLEVYQDDHPPDSHHIMSTGGGKKFPSYYCRLRVHNQGGGEAKGVEVQMLALRKKGPDGQMAPDPVFLPLDLQWSFGEVQRPKLLPGVFRYCDLVHVDSPAPDRLVFHNAGFPAMPNEIRPGEHPTIKAPGEYELDVAVAARNAATIHRILSIRFTGVWRNSDDDMAREGLRVRVLAPIPQTVVGVERLTSLLTRAIAPLLTVLGLNP
jgi:hypothetical protein